MALNVQGVNNIYGGNYDMLSALMPSGFSNAISSLNSENALIDANFDSGPTAEETASIAKAQNSAKTLNKILEDRKVRIETLKKELDELNEELAALFDKYNKEDDNSKKRIIMAEIDGVQGEVLGKISSINTEVTLFTSEQTLLGKAVEQYKQTVSTVNENIKSRSEAAQALAIESLPEVSTPKPFENQEISEPQTVNNPTTVANVNGGEFEQYGYNSERGAKFAAAALQTSTKMNTRGWCYRGVIQSLAKVGITGLTGGSAYMAADQLAKRNDLVEVSVKKEDLKDLPAGAIVVWDRGDTEKTKHGHISISLGDGRESSDHINGQYKNCGNGTFRVFLPK